MENENYIVVTIKNWNVKVYDEIIKNYPGNWHLITDPHKLTVERLTWSSFLTQPSLEAFCNSSRDI